jgi:hypothetical protein
MSLGKATVPNTPALSGELCYGLTMNSTALPRLAAGVEHVPYRGGPLEELTVDDGGITLHTLRAYYRVHGLIVVIGWVVGHEMGSFREPNQLKVDFDSHDFGTRDDTEQGHGGASAFDGITTSFLRSIPMAHARALMRERHEQLSVAKLREEMTPFPGRVQSDADYVHIATAYVALGATSVEPIKRLSEWTDESVDTWSARLRRARTRGILEGKGRNARIGQDYIKLSNEIRGQLRSRKP